MLLLLLGMGARMRIRNRSSHGGEFRSETEDAEEVATEENSEDWEVLSPTPE